MSCLCVHEMVSFSRIHFMSSPPDSFSSSPVCLLLSTYAVFIHSFSLSLSGLGHFLLNFTNLLSFYLSVPSTAHH